MNDDSRVQEIPHEEVKNFDGLVGAPAAIQPNQKQGSSDSPLSVSDFNDSPKLLKRQLLVGSLNYSKIVVDEGESEPQNKF